METIGILIILFFSIILHEVSHGLVAAWNGDSTAKEAGRLTLNPLPHMDLLGTILLPGLLLLMHSHMFFGWAKPVPIDLRRFKHRKLGIFTVGVAGPLTNVGLAVLFAGLFRVLADRPVASWLVYGVSINVFLALFNLVPIPPLDGSRAIGVFLSKDLRRLYDALEPWGFVIVVVFLYSGILGRVLWPPTQTLILFLTGLS